MLSRGTKHMYASKQSYRCKTYANICINMDLSTSTRPTINNKTSSYEQSIIFINGSIIFPACILQPTIPEKLNFLQ